METNRGLPLNVQVISCTLEELAENCKTTTKEIFKLLNLKGNVIVPLLGQLGSHRLNFCQFQESGGIKINMAFNLI